MQGTITANPHDSVDNPFGIATHYYTESLLCRSSLLFHGIGDYGWDFIIHTFDFYIFTNDGDSGGGFFGVAGTWGKGESELGHRLHILNTVYKVLLGATTALPSGLRV